MGLFKKTSGRRESVYNIFKDIVVAMEQAGTCSAERAKELKRALDFAIVRDNTFRYIENRRRNTPLTFADWRARFACATLVFIALARIGFGISWFLSICVSLIAAWFLYSIILSLEHLVKLATRIVNIATFNLSMRIAETRSIPLYEARSEVEHMRYVELGFEEQLLDKDILPFPYQISDACLWKGDCEKCDGTTMGRVSGDSRCLHKCHQASQTVTYR